MQRAINSVNRTTGKPLRQLRKMHLFIHPLYWIDHPLGQEPNERTAQWNDQFPNRWEFACELEVKLQERYRRLIREAREDEGMFFLPTREPACCEMVDLARQHFGPRLASLEDEQGNKFDRDMPYIHELLGAELANELKASLEDDRQAALKNRGPVWEKHSLEWSCWEWSKTWAWFLNKTLEDQGYTYDPQTVDFEAFGENWFGCVATYTINLGRALRLARPIKRQFELINPDYIPMLFHAEVIEQNVPGPDNTLLFIFRTANRSPTWGQLIAQFYEGQHGVMDRPRVIEVDFPPNSVYIVTNFGWPIERALGIWGRSHGSVELSIGYGGHFHHPATWVMPLVPKPMEKRQALSAEQLRDVMLAGRIKQVNELAERS